MAASQGRKTASSNRRTGKSTASGRTASRRKKTNAQMAQDGALFHEIGLIVLFAAMVFLFCCNFGIIGPIGDAVSGVLFGVFGFMAYVLPVLLFLAAAFYFANEGNANATRKLAAGVVLFLMAGIVCDLVTKQAGGMEKYDVKILYGICREARSGGGVLAGSVSYLLQQYLETLGTVLVVLLCSVVSLILLTERSLLDSVKRGGSHMRELSREDAIRRREQNELRRQEQEENAQRRKEQNELRRQEQAENRARRAQERRLKAEAKENEKILRMERKVSGVMLDTALQKPQEDAFRRDDIHEIILSEEDAEETPVQETYNAEPCVEEEPEAREPEFDFEKIPIRGIHQVALNEESAEEEYIREDEGESMPEPVDEPVEESAPGNMREIMEQKAQPSEEHRAKKAEQPQERPVHNQGPGNAGEHKPVPSVPKKYMLPPLSLLAKGAAATGDSERELRDTARRLQQTLDTFGVKVTITDISQGPSVTRYELQPEQGVKVSKIVGLSDDIKMHLAATDIRIEAPIPGKAAIGIEVPNKENMAVALRDLLESREFKEHKSNIAFAVGKDIAGKAVVSDIAKMPHMLIAGATGSGKSVCINTLIMSILYKAHPDDVKLIMVDPKVVELSIYNGIPHLLIPVVTDPKKASSALQWAVSEMEDRYRKFADLNVRKLEEYNKKLETRRQKGEESLPPKLPQIVIIVDELADLMMVAPGEVEESICRLAQLARAAGIHLIIATQRPSVDVITGLIKANMPSRIAFAVSSGVDSRTILDMVGAEKLLGKGDMLFYPQGYPKPARIQGAFVSDDEVQDVVEFLKAQNIITQYSPDIEQQMKTVSAGAGSAQADSASAFDEYFVEAGKFIIEKDKASIGMLQRVFKIGFNRAARIMDQLCEAGVVGEEEGTKPRKVLMSPEQFESFVEESM